MIWRKYGYLLDYRDCFQIMQTHVNDIIYNSHEDVVLVLEHKDVYTIGTSGHLTDVMHEVDNIDIMYTNRGGQVTYHGPGQLVIYPMLNLNHKKMDVRWYVNSLSEVIINLCKHFGLNGFYNPANVGVWVHVKNDLPKKIASIGIRVKKWVTYHGVAINICPDMTKFNGINPCGLNANNMTSFAKLGIDAEINLINDILRHEFYKVFI